MRAQSGKKGVRRQVIVIRLLPEVAQKVKAKAAESGQSISAYVVALLSSTEFETVVR